jgi:hypothetical protein
MLADGSFTYTPDAGFIGLDSFTYSVNDGFGGTATATAFVAVQGPGNTAPVAEDDTAATRPGEAVAIAVLDNDSDADNDPLTVSPIAGPANGTLSVDADGVVTYTPDAGFRGTDSFDYQLSDGEGGIDTATVVINVFNADPDAVDDTASTDAGTPVLIAVLDNDTDADSDNLFVSTVTGPANGSLVLGANGVYSYTPNAGFSGTDSFVYAVDDGYGGTDTATVTVDVEAEGLNLVIGTSRTVTLRGTADADAIIAGAAPIVQMYGEDGADVFVFGLHAGNGQRNSGYIRDFDLSEDFIDLAGATVASHFTLGGSTYLALAGADRDLLVVNGVTDYNSLTARFIDDWPGRADALFA